MSKPKAYYNEIDPKCCAWLQSLMDRELIMAGTIDNRSIEDVNPDDLTPFTRVGFFSGIGGWEVALQLAGWPEDKPVWHGSCPCQPFSTAGKGAGTADERHLWPAFKWLIEQCKPPAVFGEQVASAAGREWLAGVRADLEGMAYDVGAADLCAASQGYPHARQRLWWFAHAAVHGCEGIQRCPAAQVSQDGASETLGAWDSSGNPFRDWKKLLAETRVDRMDDGVSSALVVRPALHSFGNAIVPQVAAQFILACEEAIGELLGVKP